MRHSVAAALLTTCLLAGCGKHAPPPPRPKPAVDVVTLHTAPLSMTSDLPGRLTAYRVAEVRPQVSGVILRRLFVEGDLVHAGQPLYQIDPKPYEASLASARATAAKARAAVAAARLTVKRYRPLARAFAISGQDMDNAVAALGQDEADVASGDASVQSADINLAYTRMNAPITGRTGRSSVTEGALVTQNQTDSLVTVTALDPIYVDVTEPTATLLRLKREYAAGLLARTPAGPAPADGGQTEGGAGGAAVSLILDDGTDYPQQGRLLFSEVSADEATGSVTLRALFPNPDGLLLPGMFVRERIEEGVRRNALLVPQRAVTHDERGQPTAMTVDKDGKISLHVLVTARAIGNDWLVTQGLAGGDRVIVSGLQQARPGETVTVRDVAADGAALTPMPAAAQN